MSTQGGGRNDSGTSSTGVSLAVSPIATGGSGRSGRSTRRRWRVQPARSSWPTRWSAAWWSAWSTGWAPTRP